MKRLMILGIVLFTSFSIFAQRNQDNRPNRRINFGGGVELGLPMGSFQESLGTPLFGVNANVSVPLGKRSPIELGADYKFQFMGSDREDILVTEVINQEGTDEQLVVEHEGTFKMKQRMHNLHAQVRLKPWMTKVSPYVDGLAGFRTSRAFTKLRVDNNDFQVQERAVVGPRTNASLSYGAAIGTTVRLSSFLHLDLKYSYLWGSPQQYMDPQSIDVNGASQDISYEMKESRTDMMSFTVGLRF